MLNEVKYLELLAPFCQRGGNGEAEGAFVSVCLMIFWRCLPVSSFSFFAFGSFFTFCSTRSARLLLPTFFRSTSSRGPLPLRYFAPPAPLPRCSANLRATSVVMPVYRLPSRHLIKYKYQSDIIKFQRPIPSAAAREGNITLAGSGGANGVGTPVLL